MIDHHKLEEFRGAEINVQYPEVLPLDMVDKSTSLSKTIWDWVFDRVQSREAFSSRSEGHPSSLLAVLATSNIRS